MSNADTDTTLTIRCREVLGRMGRGSVPAWTVPADVRKELESRKLIAEHDVGYLAILTRASGYVSDPSTFEATL